MIIQSDWHIHSKNSYDASLTLDEISSKAKEYRFKKMGITDHVNVNDVNFLNDFKNSYKDVNAFKLLHPEIVLGVELTPIAKPHFDYLSKTGTGEGYIPPVSDKPYDIELALTKEEMVSREVSYAIGATHWRVDSPYSKSHDTDVDAMIKEWYRQQMWLACDDRVTVLGHPWYNGYAAWYDDFSVIPKSMNLDIASALKENGKYVECNAGVLCSPKASERFRIQYAEFLRELFEMGIPVTYGSDNHVAYGDTHIEVEKILRTVGFSDGDFSEISEKDFWDTPNKA